MCIKHSLTTLHLDAHINLELPFEVTKFNNIIVKDDNK